LLYGCGLRIGEGLGVRVRTGMTEDKGKGKLTNAEGKAGEARLWGLVSAWCDYSGEVDGTAAGLAIFAAPTNPVPTAWHSRGYGLLSANPFGRGKAGFPATKGETDLVKLPKGEHLKLRYGILVHPGDVKEGKFVEWMTVGQVVVGARGERGADQPRSGQHRVGAALDGLPACRRCARSQRRRGAGLDRQPHLGEHDMSAERLAERRHFHRAHVSDSRRRSSAPNRFSPVMPFCKAAFSNVLRNCVSSTP